MLFLGFYMGKSLNCRFLRNYWSLCNKTWYIYTVVSNINIWRFINAKCHSLTFVQSHWVFNNFKHLLLRNLLANLSQISCGTSHGIGERNFVQMVQVTCPTWPPCPYMVKTFKTLLLWNREANDHETWCTAWGTQIIHNLFKWWLYVYCKVIFAPLSFFIWGKSLTVYRCLRYYWNTWYK